MAPKPSYQLLIWSVPTVALLLTCLWYRRKRSSLRNDPGGTASVDLAALLSKRRDHGREPAAAQGESQCESTQQVETTATEIIEHKEIGSTKDQCKKSESDSVSSIQRRDLYTSQNKLDIKNKSLLLENSLESHHIVSYLGSEPLILKTKEVDKLSESSKVSGGQEEITEETLCKGKSEENSQNKEIIECKEKSDETCKAETEDTESKVETTDCGARRSEEVVSINNITVLSEELSEDISDKSIDILTNQQVQESNSVTKPCSGTVFISDSLSPEQPAEEACVFSSDECGVTSGLEPESLQRDLECTAVQSSLCESCSVSDIVPAKQRFEDSGAVTSAESAVSASGSVEEAGCSSGSVAGRTVMARKSSTDLAMERPADSDGAAQHRESKLSASEHSVQAERDSANHSPADVMLGSPAISNYSDANSEGSSDSGKGCSDMATPPPRTPASGSSLAGDVPSIYEFVLPQHLVGRLIGRFGAFVHQIKDKTNANILIKKHPDTTKLKICAIEGNQMGIDRALEMIRDKFPQKKYPNVTLEQVCFVPATPVFPVPQCVQLRLVEGVNNDVIVSYMVTPAHVFLQQPTHPTFLNLSALAAFMQTCYCEPEVPALPRPVAADVICVAPVMGDWCRAQVVTDEAEDGTSTIRLLDYGGYDVVDCSVLRQIRQDFMLLPFQAAEAYLANISPAGGVEEEWSKEAFDVLEELTKGQVVEAQVVGYAENSVPIVYLFSIVRSKAIFVNYELVKRGLAEWTEGFTIMNGSGIALDGNVAEECGRPVAAEQ
ncbi:A-kinase anchor protein 1, mitochondrial-like isoform X2 [Bacillus rossius redtenbacheri]